ncbi:MAG: 30S ribosomal protein S16 [Minisyncoccia bacterium]
MLKIRLQRVGRVHEPSFRLVLTDLQNSTKSGRFKEILGSYDPRKSTDALETERIKYWLSQGADPTATVHNLLVRHRIITAKKINVSSKSKKAPVVKEEAKEAVAEEVVKEETVEEAPKEAAPQEEAVAEEVPAPTENAIIEPVVEEKVEEEKTV